MEIISSCNTASITPYVPNTSNPWDVMKVKHLYKRLAYGATTTVLDAALSQTPQEVVDALLLDAQTTPNTPAPAWAYWDLSDFNDYDTENNEFISEWYRQAAKDIRDKNLKGRLTFFWLNHFVTQIETYFYAPYTFQYWDILQTHCLGNFKTFVREMGLNPAMLLFLNGFENSSQNPNENYARELYELFTLGEGNGYTQQDIEETSRALTGYNHWVEYGAAITFDESTFDSSEKTIFGQTGPWGYDDVIDILFEQKASIIATTICTKLYTYFVSPDINDAIVAEMATLFMDQNWEIEPVLEMLFKSEHFFDQDAIGMIVKSPYDLIMTFYNELDFTYNDTDDGFASYANYISDMLGQNLFQPIDVAGWQRNHDWINSSTLTGRWLSLENLSWNFWLETGYQYRDFAQALTNSSTDPVVITKTIVDYFLSRPLYTEADYEIAEAIFKWETPENYWEDGIWNWNFDSAAYQTILLIHHIFRMPEFQLK